MNKRQRVAFVFLAGLMMLMLIIKSRPVKMNGSGAAFYLVNASSVKVQIKGDVRYPGVYDVPDKKMAIDAIKMAEPFCLSALRPGFPAGITVPDDGYLVFIDCKATNNQHVTVVAPMPATVSLLLGLPISLNDATAEDLTLLPGIGSRLADRIVRHRHNNGGFGSLDELKEVEGIGEKKLNNISKHLKTL